MALGLENTARAVAEMQFSAPTYETVHVAGSNGKGTTVARLSAALSSAGIDHLAFTSPHLVRVEERVRHNGRPVDATTFDEALVQVHDMVKRTGISLTFFEATFLIFLSVAARLSVRVVLMETGLGGRLDATRAVPADVAVITSLSLEHTTVLGDTLEAIAGEKGAIARSGKPLVVQWVENPAARKRLERCAAEAGDHPLDGRLGPADLRWVKPETGANYRDQADALAALAWSHLKCAENMAYPNIRELHWPGRMQDVVSAKRSNLVFVLEGAHNPSGMRTACDELAKQHRWRRPWALLFRRTCTACLNRLRCSVRSTRLRSWSSPNPNLGATPAWKRVPCETMLKPLASRFQRRFQRPAMPSNGLNPTHPIVNSFSALVRCISRATSSKPSERTMMMPWPCVRRTETLVGYQVLR